MSSKVITIFGATGYQGTSVIDSLLQNKANAFCVRGITRSPDSDKAKALASRGVEIVKADGLVKEQLVEAFKGSWGVFANTNSDDPVGQHAGLFLQKLLLLTLRTEKSLSTNLAAQLRVTWARSLSTPPLKLGSRSSSTAALSRPRKSPMAPLLTKPLMVISLVDLMQSRPLMSCRKGRSDRVRQDEGLHQCSRSQPWLVF